MSLGAHPGESSSVRLTLSIRGDVELALPDQLAVDGSQDAALSGAKAGVDLGRFHHGHRDVVLPVVGGHVAEQLGKGIRLDPQYPLEFSHPIRPGRGLTEQPLGHRRLRDAECLGELLLRRAALLAGPLERLREPASLLGCGHRHDPRPSRYVSPDVKRMPHGANRD
jgi:hypothetical protein